MATLSERPDNSKASALRKRDFQHSHDGPETPPHRRKRDPKTRQWCRRVEGRQHILVRITHSWGYSVDRCSVCGKHVNWYWARPWVKIIVPEQTDET